MTAAARGKLLLSDQKRRDRFVGCLQVLESSEGCAPGLIRITTHHPVQVNARWRGGILLVSQIWHLDNRVAHHIWREVAQYTQHCGERALIPGEGPAMPSVP